ncbi:putative uncharacterized protein [Bacteroides sp. CAG:927]|nr:putative uncharacterized protein [Bacteroides sp. CAG:927]
MTCYISTLSEPLIRAVAFNYTIMRKTLWIALFSVCVLAANAQTGVYRYNVMYSFGFIHKEVGHAVVSIATNGSDFTGVLNGKSINWGGRIYTVRDTLRAVMHCTPYTPPVGITENVRFQIGWYAKPLAAELKNESFVFSNPDYYRNTHGQGRLDASRETMEAVEISGDMLALFYFFWHMDFSALHPDQVCEVPVVRPDGNVQRLSLTYLGTGDYSSDGVFVPTYRVRFDYYLDGKPSGYPVTCAIERSSRVPVEFSAALKIGHFKMVRRF